VRKICLLLVTIYIFFCGITIAHAEFQKNEPNGFRNIKWDASISMYDKEMVFVKKELDTSYYFRKDDKMSIGACVVDEIFYKFDSKGFIGAQIHARNEDNYMKLLKVCVDNWGTPKKGVMYYYQWHGNITKVDCTYNTTTRKIIMFINSVEGEMRRANFEKKATESAGQSDF